MRTKPYNLHNNIVETKAMDRTEIVNRIGYIRVRAKLTQKALSYAIGMNPSYINRLESKKDFLPSLEVLLKIIEVCGSTEEEFFSRDIAEYERDKELIEKIKSLPEDIKGWILNYDQDLMNLFVTLNNKLVRLKDEDMIKAKSYKRDDDKK